MAGLESLPLIMFSHPRSLALRISVGRCPTEMGEYPVSHIRHSLPTLCGSSGANILFSSIIDKKFQYWLTAFVHYRHGCAVAWQAIGPQIREYFESIDVPLRGQDEEFSDQEILEHVEVNLAIDATNHPHQQDFIRGKLQLRM